MPTPIPSGADPETVAASVPANIPDICADAIDAGTIATPPANITATNLRIFHRPKFLLFAF
jgi:hypothetical protein